MMRRIAIGRQSFSFLREGGFFYVDKTLFLRDWYLAGDPVTLITRPRRFGKTLTLDMVRCFFSPEFAGREDLFRGLKIARNRKMMELQGTTPVILLSFAGEHPNTMRSFLRTLLVVTAEAYKSHLYLLENSILSSDDQQKMRWILNDVQDIPDPVIDAHAYEHFVSRLCMAVRDLSSWIERYHGHKVLVLMDEYDTPLQAAFAFGYSDRAIQVMQCFMESTLKENTALDKALLFGITQITEPFSTLPRFASASILTNRYAQDIGFTQKEVHQVLKTFKLLTLEEDVKDGYDGFTIGNEVHIYSPWSICNFLRSHDHTFQPYWAQTGGLGLVDELMRKSSPQVQRDLNTLILGQTILVDIHENFYPRLNQAPDTVWSLLLFAGYIRLASQEELTPAAVEPTSHQFYLTFTNRETRGSIVQMAQNWLVGNHTNGLKDFLHSVQRHNVDGMQKALQSIVDLCVCSFELVTHTNKGKYQPETYFQGLMTGLTAGCIDRFHLFSNGESGDGRFDLALEPKNPADDVSIFEFEVFDKTRDHTITDTARRALSQITDQRYAARFLAKGYSQARIHCYGIGFRGKNVSIQTSAS